MYKENKKIGFVYLLNDDFQYDIYWKRSKQKYEAKIEEERKKEEKRKEEEKRKKEKKSKENKRYLNNIYEPSNDNINILSNNINKDPF